MPLTHLRQQATAVGLSSGTHDTGLNGRRFGQGTRLTGLSGSAFLETVKTYGLVVSLSAYNLSAVLLCLQILCLAAVMVCLHANAICTSAYTRPNVQASDQSNPALRDQVAKVKQHSHTRALLSTQPGLSTVTANSCVVQNFYVYSYSCTGLYPTPACCSGKGRSDICSTNEDGAGGSCDKSAYLGCCP